MQVTPEEVRRIAALARLALTDAEVERLTAEVGEMLRHVAALEEADLSDLSRGDDRRWAAPAGIDAEKPDAERPDRADPDPLHRMPDQIAPAWSDPFFVVPRLASHDARGEDAGAEAGEVEP